MNWNKYPETKPDIIHKGKEFLITDGLLIDIVEWNDESIWQDHFDFVTFNSYIGIGPLELPNE